MTRNIFTDTDHKHYQKALAGITDNAAYGNMKSATKGRWSL